MTQNIRLGYQENRLLFSLEKEKISVFTFRIAKKILESTDSSVWNVLGRLKKKGRIHEIQNGKYLLVPARAGPEGYWSEDPWLIVPQLIDVYYVGFWTAMNYWEMTEQIPYTIFVVTTKRKKKRVLEFGQHKFQFVTLTKKKFFGFIEERIGKNMFNISNREKTIVDGLMHPEYCGGITEVTKAMWNSRNEVDWEKILEYSKNVKIDVVLRRLGYLLSILEIENKISNKVKENVKRYLYHFLDPVAEKDKFEYSKDFGLKINRTKNELVSWKEY